MNRSMNKLKSGLIAALVLLALLFVTFGFARPWAARAETAAQTTSLSEMLSGVIAAGTGEDGYYSKSVTDGALFDYALGYGGLDGEGVMQFHPYEVNNGGLRTSAVYNTTGYQPSVLLTGGTARAGNFEMVGDDFVPGQYGVVAKLTAKDHLNVTITNGSRENNEANLNVGVYIQSGDAVATETTIPVGTSVAANDLGGTYFVRSGETLYYVFYTDAYTDDSTKFARTFYSAIWPTFAAEATEPIPVITAGADADSITAGGNVTLTWSATESAQVSVTYTKDGEPASGLSPVSGEPFTIAEAGVYVFTFAADGAESKQVTVTVREPAVLTEMDMTIEEMVQASIAAGGGVMENIGVQWRLEYGTVGEPLYNFAEDGGPYTDNDGIVSTTRIDSTARNSSGYAAVYFDSDYQSSGSGRLRTDHVNGYDFVISFTALQNVVVHVTNEAWIKGSDSLGAEYSTVVMRTVEGESYYITTNYSKQSYPSSVEADALGQEIHLAAGDSLYYVINGVNDSGYVTLLPDFTVTTEGYDADKVFDFAAYIAAIEHAAEVKAQVQAAYDAVNFDDYEAADYLEICELYETALADIDAALTTEEVDGVAAELEDALANYLTKTQAADRRAELAKQLADYVATLDSANYSEEDWATITGVRDGFAETVSGLTKADALNAAYDAAKAQIDAVGSGSNSGGNNGGGEGCGGCGSSVAGGSALLALGALGAAAATFKKRSKK